MRAYRVAGVCFGTTCHGRFNPSQRRGITARPVLQVIAHGPLAAGIALNECCGSSDGAYRVAGVCFGTTCHGRFNPSQRRGITARPVLQVIAHGPLAAGIALNECCGSSDGAYRVAGVCFGTTCHGRFNPSQRRGITARPVLQVIAHGPLAVGIALNDCA